MDLDPNRYIWRRRIEQYGPRLSKPYAFYDWVAAARAEIARRGETPDTPRGGAARTELAGPGREPAAPARGGRARSPGRIRRDEEGLIEAEVAVVPSRLKAGSGGAGSTSCSGRSPGDGSHWNNESAPLRVWVGGPEGWSVEPPLLEAERGPAAESDEPRLLDLEVKPPADAPVARSMLRAYALYNVCETAGGRCLFLRQDLPVRIVVE